MQSPNSMISTLRDIGGKFSVALIRSPIPRQGDEGDTGVYLNWTIGGVERGDQVNRNWKKGAYQYRGSLVGHAGSVDFTMWLGKGNAKKKTKLVKGAATEYKSVLLSPPAPSENYFLTRIMSVSGFADGDLLDFMRLTGFQENCTYVRDMYRTARELWEAIVAVIGPDARALANAGTEHELNKVIDDDRPF